MTVRSWCASVGISLLTLLFLGISPPAISSVAGQEAAAEESAAAGDSAAGYERIIALLQEQEQKQSRELRQIKRELAALAQQLEKPGIAEIMGGIGYIVGLFGIAAYVASRNRKSMGKG